MRLAALSLILAASLAPTNPAPKATPPPQAAPPAKTATPETKGPNSPEFPKNEAGGRAASWFLAFNAGKASMKRYIKAQVAPAALQKLSVGERMEIYRDMKDERGKVTALEVREFTEWSVKVIARGERGGRFEVTFLCEDDAPHRLLGIRVEDLPPEEGKPEAADDAEYSEAPCPRLARSA